MPRYFLEVAYHGAAYSGFQSQHNANTIQAEIEKVIDVLSPLISRPSQESIKLTGSSRTDAGVHALQNFFHFDSATAIKEWRNINSESQFVYKINAVLPGDIVVKGIKEVSEIAHCRFDAISREYNYYIYQQKDPFINDRAFYFPYKLDLEKMQEAASVVKEYTDFTSFSKRNTQVKNFICSIRQSQWLQIDNQLVYNVKANRFLRGMVRALTATMLQIGRGKLNVADLRSIIEAKDCTKASFAVPAHGLFLIKVNYK